MSPDQQEEIIADLCSSPSLKFSQREAVRRLLQERNSLRKAAQPVAPVAQVPEGFSRDFLGRAVREAWVRWAITQPNPKPSWLVPYDELSEPDKEADRQIGEAIAMLATRQPSAHAVPDVEGVIEKIVEYGAHRENEGGSYATFQKSEARQHRAEADDVLAEIRDMLAASPAAARCMWGVTKGDHTICQPPKGKLCAACDVSPAAGTENKP